MFRLSPLPLPLPEAAGLSAHVVRHHTGLPQKAAGLAGDGLVDHLAVDHAYPLVVLVENSPHPRLQLIHIELHVQAFSSPSPSPGGSRLIGSRSQASHRPSAEGGGPCGRRPRRSSGRRPRLSPCRSRREFAPPTTSVDPYRAACSGFLLSLSLSRRQQAYRLT